MISFRGVEEESRRLAAAIPEAQVVAIPGQDPSPFVGDEVTDEVERLLSAPYSQSVPDRVLATGFSSRAPGRRGAFLSPNPLRPVRAL